MMGSLSTICSNGKEVVVIDYSNSNEDEMIDLVHKLIAFITLQNKDQLILNNFTDSYATPKFMDAVRREEQVVFHLIRGQAMIGLNEPKRWILKAYNLHHNTDYPEFKTQEEALLFLTR
jgi:50S ribosomal subunit-associated GTPase HflX